MKWSTTIVFLIVALAITLYSIFLYHLGYNAHSPISLPAITIHDTLSDTVLKTTYKTIYKNDTVWQDTGHTEYIVLIDSAKDTCLSFTRRYPDSAKFAVSLCGPHLPPPESTKVSIDYTPAPRMLMVKYSVPSLLIKENIFKK